MQRLIDSILTYTWHNILYAATAYVCLTFDECLAVASRKEEAMCAELSCVNILLLHVAHDGAGHPACNKSPMA